MTKTRANHPGAATTPDEKPKRTPKVGTIVAIGRRSAAAKTPEPAEPAEALEVTETSEITEAVEANSTPETTAADQTLEPAAAIEASEAPEPLAAAEVPQPEPPAPSTKAPTKIQTVVALLRQPEGARLEALMAATGWQAHSVRGAMSGAIKKGLGLTVLSEKVDDGRIYRIPEAQA